MRKEILAVALLTCGWQAAVARADDAAALLTQGKLDVDMGKPYAAAEAFETAAADMSAPALLRAEALVRLGLVRRDLGDAEGAAQAFEEAWTDYGHDKDALRFLVMAVAGALPGEERWNEIWDQVVVQVDRSDVDRPVVRVEWPGVPNELRKYAGTPPISLDFKDGNLTDIFRLFADITQLNVVVHPGTQGKVTFKAREIPWDEALDIILKTNGLAATHVGNIVEIGPPTRLGTRRHFEGKPIDLHFKGHDLVEALQRIADNGGRTVSVAPGVAGKVWIKLQQVPWDQAFDVVVRVNRLSWKMEGTNIRVGFPGDLR